MAQSNNNSKSFSDIIDAFTKSFETFNKNLNDLNRTLNNADNVFASFSKSMQNIPFIFDPLSAQISDFANQLKKVNVKKFTTKMDDWDEEFNKALKRSFVVMDEKHSAKTTQGKQGNSSYDIGKEMFSDFINKFKKVYEYGFIKTAMDGVEKLAQTTKNIAPKIADSLINPLKQASSTIYNSIAEPIKKTFDTLGETAKSAYNNTSQVFKNIFDKLPDSIKKVTSEVATDFKNISSNIASNLIDPISKSFESLKTVASDVKDKLVDPIKQVFKDMTGTAVSLFDPMKSAMIDLGKNAVQSFKTLSTEATAIFTKMNKNIVGWFKRTEKDVEASKESEKLQSNLKNNSFNNITKSIANLLARPFTTKKDNNGGGGGGGDGGGGGGGGSGDGGGEGPVFKAGFTPANFQNSILQIKSLFGMFSESLTFATDSLKKLAFVSAFFVKAFAPAYVEMFMYALKDLTAVIGSAFLPLLQAFTVLTKYIADMLLPVINQLQPALQAIGMLFINLLAPIIKALATALFNLSGTINNTFLPAIGKAATKFAEFIADIITHITPVVDLLIQALSGLVTVVSFLASVVNFLLNVFGLFSNIIGDLVGGALLGALVVAIGSLVAAILPFLTVTNLIIAALFTFSSLLMRFVKWLSGYKKEEVDYQANASQGMAARQAQYSTAEDISKNLIKAAFGGPNGDRLKNIDMNGRKQVELLEKIANKNPGAKAPNNMRGLAAE